MTRGWIFAKILLGLHREGQGRYTPLVGLFENEREKREVRGLGLSWLKFKFEFEFFKLEEKVGL
jgi:hypothetical protein